MKMALATKVVVVTGATSGIGLSLLERLLLETKFQFLLRICILCRNLKKGEYVRSALLLCHNSAEIDLLKMDTGNVRSVLDAATALKEKYSHIDYLFMNAGILPIKKLNFMGLLSKDILYRLKTGDVVVEADNPINELGIPTLFATNILGHFLLFQDLHPLLKSSNKKSPAKVIWTTSNNAVRSCFEMSDFMCKRGTMPYGNSKYIMNAVSVSINRCYNREGIYSYLAEPGLCITGMSGNFLPRWLWTITKLLFMMLRLFMSHLTLSAYNGAEALVWLFRRDARHLEKDCQYESAVNVFNQAYIKSVKLQLSVEESEEIFKRMCKVAEDAREQAKY